MKNKLDNQGKLRFTIKKLQHENSLLKMKLAFAEADVAKKRAAEAVSEGEANNYKKEFNYLNLVLENATNILFLLDFDKKFAYASKAFMETFGILSFNVIKDSYYKDVFHPIMNPKNLMKLSGAINYAKTQNVVVPFEEEVDAAGQSRMYVAHVSPMVNEEYVSTGIMVLLNDVTEINYTLEDTKQANLSKTKFLASMSHEIRTPMNSIVGVSDIQLGRKDICAETRDAFERINTSGKVLLGIIADILDLSTMETGKMELLPNKYDTASLINDIIRLSLMRVEDKGLKFSVKVGKNVPATLFGDELRVKQVVNNIISNAVLYTEKGEIFVEIDTEIKDDVVTLIFVIKDTGTGMTAEQLSGLLHDELSAFKREANRAVGGSGLGISIAKSLAEMMDGKIEAETQLEKGSKFTISLVQNLVDGDAAPLSRYAAESLEKFKFDEMQRGSIVRAYMPYGRVLVVDDMHTNLFVAEGLLKPYGIAVDTALSGFEAIEKIDAGNVYDIIFMDHMMPEMDGMEATKLIRLRGYTASIIALTANVVAGQEEVFLENGFDDFMAKPIDIWQLNDVLNRDVRDKQSEQTIAAASLGPAEGDTGNTREICPLRILRQIDDIDVDTALDAMADMEDLYIDTVRFTTKFLPSRIEKTKELLKADLKGFAIEVHGLKSALKSIGAFEIGHLSAQLESAALDDDVDFCQQNYPYFREKLIGLESTLRKLLLVDEDEKAEGDANALKKGLDKAKAAAENFDRDGALEIVSSLANFTYGDEIDTLLTEIVAALEAFDCEAAKNKIEEMESV